MGMAQVIELHPGRARLRVAGEVRAWKGRLRMSQAAIAALIAVQELLGHASLSTTRIYLDPRQDVMILSVLGVA